MAPLRLNRDGVRTRPGVDDLVDSERARESIRALSVPFGVRVEPSNVRSHGRSGEGLRRAIGDTRSHWSFRGRSLLDAGLPLALSSDRPVAPGPPLAGIQAFVQRLTEEARPYGPNERITPTQAVTAATTGSARVTGQHDRKGRLIPGQLADLVVLKPTPPRSTRPTSTPSPCSPPPSAAPSPTAPTTSSHHPPLIGRCCDAKLQGRCHDR
ncbi:amidohydrolase family protein [Microlunatus ginsengisoli]|uniref:Amidohydrolase 3 domain-containing protein n=1 Tax=Microlunatus ginsengisoli TaxID=363863 RepID=A0ABP7ACH9_9ACTN